MLCEELGVGSFPVPDDVAGADVEPVSATSCDKAAEDAAWA